MCHTSHLLRQKADVCWSEWNGLLVTRFYCKNIPVDKTTGGFVEPFLNSPHRIPLSLQLIYILYVHNWPTSKEHWPSNVFVFSVVNVTVYQHAACSITWIVKRQPREGALQTGNLMLLFGDHKTHTLKVLLCILINMLLQSVTIPLRTHQTLMCSLYFYSTHNTIPFIINTKVRDFGKQCFRCSSCKLLNSYHSLCPKYTTCPLFI